MIGAVIGAMPFDKEIRERFTDNETPSYFYTYPTNLPTSPFPTGKGLVRAGKASPITLEKTVEEQETQKLSHAIISLF